MSHLISTNLKVQDGLLTPLQGNINQILRLSFWVDNNLPDFFYLVISADKIRFSIFFSNSCKQTNEVWDSWMFLQLLEIDSVLFLKHLQPKWFGFKPTVRC